MLLVGEIIWDVSYTSIRLSPQNSKFTLLYFFVHAHHARTHTQLPPPPASVSLSIRERSLLSRCVRPIVQTVEGRLAWASLASPTIRHPPPVWPLSAKAWVGVGGVSLQRGHLKRSGSCFVLPHPTCSRRGQESHARRKHRPQTVSPSSPQRWPLAFSFCTCLFSKGRCQTTKPPLPFHGLFYARDFRKRERR